eukprot:3075292-Rhodomonas_salina.3
MLPSSGICYDTPTTDAVYSAGTDIAFAGTSLPTMPTSIGEEVATNPYMRVRLAPQIWDLIDACDVCVRGIRMGKCA